MSEENRELSEMNENVGLSAGMTNVNDMTNVNMTTNVNETFNAGMTSNGSETINAGMTSNGHEMFNEGMTSNMNEKNSSNMTSYMTAGSQATYENNRMNQWERGGNSQQTEARRQAELEKEKFEKSRAREMRKQEKRQAKKQSRGGREHGIVFKGVRFVAGAAVFGVLALGTMYVTGDALGMFHRNNSSEKTNPKVATTSTKNTTGTAAALKTSLASVENGPSLVNDVSEVVENVMPSIVAITSTQMVQSGYGSWFGFYYEDEGYQEQS